MLRGKVQFTFLLCYIVQVYGEWQLYDAWLLSNSRFTKNYSIDTWYLNSGGFIMPSNFYTTANFIDCQSPSTSYITLNQTYISAITMYSRRFYDSPFYFSIDLYFTGTWSGNFIFQLGGNTQTYYYNSYSGTYSYSGFCDTQSYQVKTLNFQTSGNVDANYFLSMSNSNPSGTVSLRNIVVSRPICYSPSCLYCLGTEYNQCTQCYNGNPTNGICPTCSGTTPYNMKGAGCKPACGIYSLKYQDGYCQNFPQQTFASTYFNYYQYTYYSYYAQFVKKYSVIQDVDHIDANIAFQSDSTYGIFRYKNAIFRQISEITPYNDQGSILIYITLKLTGTMPNNCGIQFKLNNSYYGSMYMNSNGMQYNNVMLYELPNSALYYSMYMMLNIPQYSFGFLIVSNDTSGNFGWSLSNFGVTSGVCPIFCQLCEIPYICKTCKTGRFLYRDGTCLGVCNQFYQTIVNTTYCQDFDDMTLYSKYLVKEYIGLEGDPAQQGKYQLISSSGTNFLKGPNIYYSFWQQNRVFGGPYVWANAKFRRVFPITSPHHSVTIAFQAIFGSSFAGILIYTSDSNPPINIQSTNNQYGGNDGSKISKFIETIPHTISTLTLQWDCSGGNGDPILGYCAFKYLYITVHYCKPYCSVCTNQYDCSSWNSTYATANPKFSQADCLTSQYFHKDTSSCKSCPLECATCVSEQGCTSCTPTFVWSILGCVCLKNQYKENNQCINCPIQCSQCLSSSFCVECLNSNYRYISNGQCVCYDGYYDVSGQAQCKVCSKLCLTCSGANSNQCLSCKTGKGLVLISGSCQCPDGTYYDELSYQCESCGTNCKTCISGKIGGQCTSCDTSNGWILKELQCVCDNTHYSSGGNCVQCPSPNMVSDGITCACISGYYQSGLNCYTCSVNEVIQGSGCVCAIGFEMVSSVCTACPTTLDATKTGCYKNCDSSTNVWFNVACTSCDAGSSVVSGNCVVDPPVVPVSSVCGNSIVEGSEQCDDGNSVQNDGCHQCKFQCPQHCTSCNSSTTFPCLDVCGDTMITGDEECEDGNTQDEDGCYQCKFKCHHACTKCLLGVCTECATSGFGLDNTVTPWTCKEKCGDKLVEGLEQCDDPTNPLCVKCRFCRIDCEVCNYSVAKCTTCATKGCEPYQNYCVNTCGDGYVVIDDFDYNTEECDDGNKINYDGCSNSCKFQCQPIDICAYCVHERCLTCAKGYYLVESQNKCEPLCGDAIHVPQEICEDLLSPPYQCRQCKPFCLSNCKTCSIDGTGCDDCQKGYKKINKICYPICGDKFITVEEECDDGNITPGDGCHFCQYHCQDSCEVCLKGECYDCREGYYFLNYQCYPIINDGQVVFQSLNIFEYCDDGNTKQYDGCYENQFQCSENCEICHYGICDYCLPGFDLDDKGICQTKCGDGILTLYTSEQCDDKNNIQYDGCYNCAYECSENCYYCNQVVCFKCEKGYRINDWLCDPVCGDKYIIPFIEECDDGNHILEDGCFECKLLCCEGCSECVLGVCYDCLQGYEFDNQICFSICGDGIVVSKEKCDDANDEEFDGCFQCDYSCPLNCESCAQGKCIRCQEEFKFIDGFCVYQEPTIIVIDNNCGNGVIDKDEECDDGNSQPLDGCFVCYVEDNWICDSNSMCEYQQTPKMIVEYLNQTLSKQYVMISFTQQIILKANQTLPGSLSYFIEDLDNDKYQLSPHIDYENNTITLTIMIFTSLSEKPRLIVELIQDICNKNGQLIENTNAFSLLNIPKYVDDQIKEQAFNLQSANQFIMITSLGVASVSVALGDFEIFFETLSALQFQSLIKYINLDFPENLLIYFQSSEVISLKPFFNFFNLDTYIEEATFKKEPVETKGKFGFYGEDADLFTSFLVQFLQSAFIVFVLLNESVVKKIVVFIINTHIYQKLLAYLYKKLGSRYPIRFQNFICSLPKFIYKFKQKINIYSFRQLLIVNAWDILLKSFLFLSAGQQFIDFRATLQTCLSIFVIGMYAVTIFHSFFPQAGSANKEFDRFQSCELIRVMLFSSVLTFIQTYQNIQLVVITMTNLVQLAFLISKRSIFEPPDFVSRCAVELSVALVMLTSFVYFQDFSNLFSYETKTKLGQAQIYMMMGGVGTVLGKMVYVKVKLIVDYLTKKPECKRPKNEILMNIVL